MANLERGNPGGARRTAVAILAIAAGVLAPAAAAPGGGEDARIEIERLRRENAILRKHVELADGKEFYLVLDPGSSSLRLMLRGAVLQDYRVQRIEIGSPRVAFVVRELPEGWRGRTWNAGNLVPPRDRERMEVEAPPPTSDPEYEPPPPTIPPTPEELYPVPRRFHVRFAGGLSLEFLRKGEADSASGRWQGFLEWAESRFADLRSALDPEAPDADGVRVRLTLLPRDVDSLYRALPPDTKLLILPDRD